MAGGCILLVHKVKANFEERSSPVNDKFSFKKSIVRVVALISDVVNQTRKIAEMYNKSSHFLVINSFNLL